MHQVVSTVEPWTPLKWTLLKILTVLILFIVVNNLLDIRLALQVIHDTRVWLAFPTSIQQRKSSENVALLCSTAQFHSTTPTRNVPLSLKHLAIKDKMMISY